MVRGLLHRLGPFAVWVALPLVCLALIFQFRVGLLAVCVYGFVLLAVASRVMAFLWLRPLVCERELSADVVEIGGRVNVICRIRNRWPLPILWLFCQETLPEKMPVEGTWRRLVFIPPGRAFHLHYSLTITRRGCHAIGPMVLESGDVFGLFKHSRLDRRRDFVTALPRYSVIEEVTLGRRRKLGDFVAERSLFDDPTSIRGIREYQRGDPLKRIHWKASARAGELRTKVCDPVTEAGATIVLDFHRASWAQARSPRPDLPPEEIGIEIALSIARYLFDGGWKLGFFSNGRDPLGLPGVSMAQALSTDSLAEALEAARRGTPDDRLEPLAIRAARHREQFDLIRENLGRLALSGGLSLGELLPLELAHINREQVLVIVTPALDDVLLTAILSARRLGYRVMFFAVCNFAAHDRAWEALAPAGVEVFRMDEEWRLREVATGRQFI